MAVLKSARHEAFARAVAQGMSATAAYKAAGYTAKGKAAETGASRTLRIAKVKARVAELKERIAEQTVKTRSQVLNDLLRNAEKASETLQFSASNQALKLYGQEAHGMFVDRHVVGLKRIEEMTEEEMRALLGLGKDEPVPDA